mmetsp:Transcript_150566/g.464642  ORF Transcript_150566/g.464642 Transcript_150566/m.464642 type:complete len:334 (+) Transcript_150566:134-1135(+)
MQEDTQAYAWPRRAACRWLAYSLLWLLTFAACLLSSYHAALQVAGAVLGCLLAASLPLLAATLFEVAYSRRTRSDVPVICCPWLGSAVVLLGALCLLRASSLLSWALSAASVGSARDLCRRFAGVEREALPRTVCIRDAFVKTEWEAGKLRCEDQGGHVHCAPAFIAAPIFNSKGAADSGLPESIWAWAVAHGRHVDANYRPDGSLCGYLSGHSDFDFYFQDYRLAVERVIDKHRLVFGGGGAVEAAAPLQHGERVPLAARPLLFALDPEEAASIEKAWLLAAVFLLCLCPCAGPLPLGVMLLFLCWARNDRYGGRHAVSPEDEDEEVLFSHS